MKTNNRGAREMNSTQQFIQNVSKRIQEMEMELSQLKEIRARIEQEVRKKK